VIPGMLLALPVAGIMLAVLVRRSRASAAVALVASATTAAGALYMAGSVLAHGPVTPGPLLAGDALSALEVLLAALLATAALSHGWGDDDDVPPERRHWRNVLSVTLLAAVCAVFLVRDIGLLCLCVQLAAIAGAGLVALRPGREADRAGARMLRQATIGVGLALLGALFSIGDGATAPASEWTSFGATIAPPAERALVAFALMVVGLGVTAAIAPLGGWLREAVGVADGPTALLVTTLPLNAAVYGILRVRAVGGAALESTGDLLTALGALSAAAGAVAIARAPGGGGLLAGASIQHVGLVIYAAGLGGAGALAALFHKTTHALSKGLLALAWRRDGSGEEGPAGGAAHVAGGLAVAGVPPSGVFVSQLLVIDAGLRGARPIATFVVCL